MDSFRFDRLSRAFAAATTRRAALVALFGGLMIFDVSGEETEAKGRGRKQRRQRGGMHGHRHGPGQLWRVWRGLRRRR
jgi:hypothetical protein